MHDRKVQGQDSDKLSELMGNKSQGWGTNARNSTTGQKSEVSRTCLH
jgi:hypothetical protein